MKKKLKDAANIKQSLNFKPGWSATRNIRVECFSCKAMIEFEDAAIWKYKDNHTDILCQRCGTEQGVCW